MYSIEPIGFIESPYKEKFAVPRQPRLVPAAGARVRLSGAANSPEALRGIEQFSHVWLLFLFDQNLDAGWKPTVRPQGWVVTNESVYLRRALHFAPMESACPRSK